MKSLTSKVKKRKEINEELELNEAIDIKIIPKIKDLFWKRKLSKLINKILNDNSLNKETCKEVGLSRDLICLGKEVCLILDLVNFTSFNEIAKCLEEIQKNLAKTIFKDLKIVCFYWDKGVKYFCLDSNFDLKEQVKRIYLKTTKNHLDDFLKEVSEKQMEVDLFIVITDKRNSFDFTKRRSNFLFYKKRRSKFLFCFVNQNKKVANVELDWLMEKNSIVVYN